MEFIKEMSLLTFMLSLLAFMIFGYGLAFIGFWLPHVFPRAGCKMGWHVIGETTEFDGCSMHATCKNCGYKGLVDSNGELF